MNYLHHHSISIDNGQLNVWFCEWFNPFKSWLVTVPVWAFKGRHHLEMYHLIQTLARAKIYEAEDEY